MTHTLTAPETRAEDRPSTWRTIGRWTVSFVGFPMGGVAAMVTVGHVDSSPRAVLGGLATGLVLGAVQAWALRPALGADRRTMLSWALATSLGLAAGVGVGATAVDFGTDLGDLVVQGLVSGLAVGAFQAVVLGRRVGALALAWPAWLAAVWATGWTVTTAIGVDVDERFTVFGSSGAVTATLLTAVLPLVLTRLARKEARA